jgi:putative FmdB family regulatory protein
MPIYEYQCQSCHHHFEEIQKVSDPPVATCPKCHGGIQRLISQTSFALKGEGWYKDGYAKPGPAKTTEPSTAKPNTTEPAKSSTPAATKPTPPSSTNKGD